MIFRALSYIVIVAFLVAGCPEVSHALVLSDGFVVYVGERPFPSDFDPYYNQPKIYRQPRYFEGYGSALIYFDVIETGLLSLEQLSGLSATKPETGMATSRSFTGRTWSGAKH